MAAPLYPLTKTQVVYTSVNPQFESLAAQTLGDAATVNDGYDAAMLSIIANTPEEETGYPDLDQNLLDAAFTPGALEGSDFLPIANDTIQFTSAGDVIASELDVSMQPPPGTGTVDPCTPRFPPGIHCNFSDEGRANLDYFSGPLGIIQQACKAYTYVEDLTSLYTQMPVARVTISSGDTSVVFAQLTTQNVTDANGSRMHYMLTITVSTKKTGSFDFVVAVYLNGINKPLLIGYCVQIESQ